MSTSHTSGPWAGSQHPSDMRGHVTIRKADCSGLVGTIYDKRDASIVAAAPELLAVMGATLATLQAVLPHLKGNQEAMVKVQILACSTAIAKAQEGRS